MHGQTEEKSPPTNEQHQVDWNRPLGGLLQVSVGARPAGDKLAN